MFCSEIPTYNFSLRKGDDKTKSFRYKADDLPVNIADYVIQFESSVAGLNQDAVIVNEADGRYNFVFTKEVTALITQSRVKYEVVFYPTGLAGDKFTKYEGSINFTNEVA